MLLSVLWARKQYPLRKYIFVLMITTGVVLFMYKGNSASKSNNSVVGWGEALLVSCRLTFSLACLLYAFSSNSPSCVFCKAYFSSSGWIYWWYAGGLPISFARRTIHNDVQFESMVYSLSWSWYVWNFVE